MSDKVKVSAPWRQGNDQDSSVEGAGDKANLLQVPCPVCGQALALGREYLGGHCLCSVCDGLMLVSLKKGVGGAMGVVAEKVDKMTGEKMTGSAPVSSPEAGGGSMDEDWENTRPVKMWSGSPGEKQADDDYEDLGATMPVPTVGQDHDDDDDYEDLGVTMPVPTVVKDHGVGLGATMPVPTVAKDSVKGGTDEDWELTAPSHSQPTAPKAVSNEGGAPWSKMATGKQGIKLAPPSGQSGKISAKAPSPTSGAVPTATTPPTKAPAPTTGSVPTLDSGQVEARLAHEQGGPPTWQPPGVSAPIEKEGQLQKGKAKADKAVKEKKSNPFGNKPSAAEVKKKKVKRKAKSHKGLVFVMLIFLLLCTATAVFIVAPGLIPYGLEAREVVDGKIDEAKGQIEGLLAERAMNADASTDSRDGTVVDLMPSAGGGGAGGGGAGEAGAAGEVVDKAPVLTPERDKALRKLLEQEGEKVIRSFYGASTVDEKLAFVVNSDEARIDMEKYFSNKDALATVRSVMFRGGTRDSGTGYYYGVFDVIENENGDIHRWCVVDPGTGLYQVDWIIYRQIAASELGAFLEVPAAEGVTQSFHMLLKVEGNVSADDSPWFDDVVKVGLQVPMISSRWYSVLMKKPLAESSGLTTELANNRMTMAVVEIAWIPGDKNPDKRLPAIVGIKRWGAWARDNF